MKKETSTRTTVIEKKNKSPESYRGQETSNPRERKKKNGRKNTIIFSNNRRKHFHSKAEQKQKQNSKSIASECRKRATDNDHFKRMLQFI